MPPQTQTPIPEQPAQGFSTLYLVAVVIALVVVATFGAYLYSQYQDGMDIPVVSTNPYQNITELIHSSSFADAASAARTAANQATEQDAQLHAKHLEATALFMQGEDSEQIEAVRIMKQNFLQHADEGNKIKQADDINFILKAMTTSRDDQVFEEAFTGTFAQYRVGDDKQASLAKLAEYSVSLNPTTVALFTTAYPHVEALEALDGAVLTDAQKKEHADALLDISRRADEIIEQELAVSTNPLDVVTYYYWTGIIYGLAATVYPEHLSSAEAAFKATFDYYDARRDTGGNRLPIVESRLPLTDLMWAMTIYRLAPEDRRVDIESHLDRIISMVSANPSRFENQFLPRLRRTAEQPAEGSDNMFAILGRTYQPFNDFLAEHGYDIN